MRQPVVAHATLILKIPNRCHVHGGIAKIVNLHEVDNGGIHKVSGPPHLCCTGCPAVGPDFGCQKQLAAIGAGSNDVADDFFRAVVHRRSVDDAAALCDHHVDNILTLLNFGCGAGDIEDLVGTQSDCGQRLARCRNDVRQHRRCAFRRGKTGQGAQYNARGYDLAAIPSIRTHVKPLSLSCLACRR